MCRGTAAVVTDSLQVLWFNPFYRGPQGLAQPQWVLSVPPRLLLAATAIATVRRQKYSKTRPPPIQHNQSFTTSSTRRLAIDAGTIVFGIFYSSIVVTTIFLTLLKTLFSLRL